MLLFWRGNGVAAPLIYLCIMILSAMIGSSVGLKDDTLGMYTFEFILSLCFCVPLYFYGKKMNSEKKVLIDKQTGKEVVLKANHSFFEVKLEYWAIVIPIIILAVAIFNSTR